MCPIALDLTRTKRCLDAFCTRVGRLDGSIGQDQVGALRDGQIVKGGVENRGVHEGRGERLGWPWTCRGEGSGL